MRNQYIHKLTGEDEILLHKALEIAIRALRQTNLGPERSEQPFEELKERLSRPEIKVFR